MPSVMILIYDWSKDEGNISWALREEDIKVCISKLRKRSKEAKLMTLHLSMNVLESRESLDNSPTNKIEYKIASLKKNTELEAKGIFLISNGLDGFAMLSK